jgi:DNA (cytosine-5)-methyltransferase 1
MKYRSEYEDYDQWLVREERRVYQSGLDGELPRKRKRFRLVDAFSGAGGMTLGFSKRFGHAFDSVWANDFNSYCVDTYNANFGDHCIPGDIVDILSDPATRIPKADVVIGGPPCQGFSLLDKNREGDPRKQLWRPFFEIVERSGANDSTEYIEVFYNRERRQKRLGYLSPAAYARKYYARQGAA